MPNEHTVGDLLPMRFLIMEKGCQLGQLCLSGLMLLSWAQQPEPFSLLVGTVLLIVTLFFGIRGFIAIRSRTLSEEQKGVQLMIWYASLNAHLIWCFPQLHALFDYWGLPFLI